MDVIYRRQKVGDCNSATDGAVAPAYFWKVHHQQQSSLSTQDRPVGWLLPYDLDGPQLEGGQNITGLLQGLKEQQTIS